MRLLVVFICFLVSFPVNSAVFNPVGEYPSAPGARDEFLHASSKVWKIKFGRQYRYREDPKQACEELARVNRGSHFNKYTLCSDTPGGDVCSVYPVTKYDETGDKWAVLADARAAGHMILDCFADFKRRPSVFQHEQYIPPVARAQCVPEYATPEGFTHVLPIEADNAVVLVDVAQYKDGVLIGGYPDGVFDRAHEAGDCSNLCEVPLQFEELFSNHPIQNSWRANVRVVDGQTGNAIFGYCVEFLD